MRRRAAWLFLAALLAPAPRAAAQLDPHRLPTLPSLPGRPGQAPTPAPVIPDTVTAPVRLLADEGALSALAVAPDSVAFGGVAWILVGGSGSALADSVGLPPWLELVASDRAGRAPEAAAGAALAVPVRVYRVDPFRLEAGGCRSNLVSVTGRTADGAATAPVRDPRRPGWNLLVVLALLLAAALAVLLAARIRIRKRARIADRPLAGPAWPALALALEASLEALAADGNARAFLNALAALTRGYVGDRFGIAGREMTGEEIAAACRRLGHPAATGRAFGRLVSELDLRRYDPTARGEAWCRERASDLLAAVAAVRLPLDPTASTSAEDARGQAAWERLVHDLQRGGGRAA